MSTNLIEAQQDKLPQGYFDIIMTTEEADRFTGRITDQHEIIKQDTLSPYQLCPGRQKSDLIHYRIKNDYRLLIKGVIYSIIESSPMITQKAKAYFAKAHYSIVYLPHQHNTLDRMLPEFSNYEPTLFTTTDDNSRKLACVEGEFSPFDVSSAALKLGIEKIIEVNNGLDQEALYCSKSVLDSYRVKSEDHKEKRTPYELILTLEQLKQLRIELNHREPLIRKNIGNNNIGVVCVNLTKKQAENYRAAFDLVQLSNVTGSSIVLSSQAHDATPALKAYRPTARTRCSFFTAVTMPSVTIPLVSLGNTLWALNLIPAFHQMLPQALGVLLSAPATPYVLAILTVLLIAAIYCQNNPIRDEISDNTANSCFSMC